MRADSLLNFMRARHQIYLDRAAGEPYPWTDDPVLRDHRFCNVFRELDTVTIWIDEHIRKPYAGHRDLWFMLAVSRYLNWPDTLADVMRAGCWDDGFSPEFLTRVLEARAAKGRKVYTGAYMIRAESDPTKEWYAWTKHRYISEIVLGRLWKDRETWAQLLEHPGISLRTAWEAFQARRYVGWGPFMAYEVVTDLRHTRYLSDAPDIMTWANAGPGAIRGLNRLHGRPLRTQPKKVQTNAEMRSLLDDLQGRWEPEVLEMRDIEHSLCEFDKYERVRLGEGKMRSKYRPSP